MEVRDYQLPNWFTASGVRRMKSKIEGKGIPNMTNWRFITLTCSEELHFNEIEAYFAGRERMRRFKALLVKHFGDDFQGPEGQNDHCWKMEFHTKQGSHFGWPHWHMAVAITRKFTEEELALLNELWGLGRVNVKRIKGESLDYFFKYCFKNPNGSEAVPDWFADYRDSDGNTFARARFWQTSPGFYTGKKLEQVEKEEPKTCLIQFTVREKLDRWAVSVVLIAYAKNGDYIKGQVTILNCKKSNLFDELGRLVLMGLAVQPFSKQYKTNSENITKYISKWQTNLINQDKQRVNLQATMLDKWQRHSQPF